MTTTSRRFLIDLPTSWREHDLSGRHLARQREAALSSASGPRQRQVVNDLFRHGRQVTSAARSRGALLAASTTTQYDDVMFMAHALVFTVTAPPGVDMTLPALTTQLTGRGSSVADREVCSAVVPAVGRVARITGVEGTEIAPGLPYDVVTMHTLMPVPDRPRQFLVVTLASPNTGLRPEVLALFGAITDTFRFTGVHPSQL